MSRMLNKYIEFLCCDKNEFSNEKIKSKPLKFFVILFMVTISDLGGNVHH